MDVLNLSLQKKKWEPIGMKYRSMPGCPNNLPVSEMTYSVSSGTLNPSIPYYTTKQSARNKK